MEIDFEESYAFGVQNGWCGAILCITHDGMPMSAAEEEEAEEYDPCIPMVRMYGDDPATRKAVEANHSPSQWRKTNEGFEL